MSAFTSSENTQILRGVTDADADTAPPQVSQLGNDVGAPWEIYIKSVSSDSSQWGNATYSSPTDAGATGNFQAGQINIDEAAKIGNAIHRILKHYLESNYQVNNIEAVRLNISLKPPPVQ